MRVLVTGGAGFIGSAVCHSLIARGACVINVDKLTYAANPRSLDAIAHDPRYAFERHDICDRAAMDAVLAKHQPTAVLHLAAESHVDRSITGAAAFIDTNITGTYHLLEAARHYWTGLSSAQRAAFRFVHVSTDEVYGSRGADGHFHEDTPYRPSSPYSASKAASDHLAQAWHRTYGLPVIVSNCSNNYGPRQFPGRLLPPTILTALAGGSPTRAGVDPPRPPPAPPLPPGPPRRKLITFVTDRPGHDQRYAIDASKARRELGWKPARHFEDGLEQTVQWYLDNRAWWEPLHTRVYGGGRLGLL